MSKAAAVCHPVQSGRQLPAPGADGHSSKFLLPNFTRPPRFAVVFRCARWLVRCHDCRTATAVGPLPAVASGAASLVVVASQALDCWPISGSCASNGACRRSFSLFPQLRDLGVQMQPRVGDAPIHESEPCSSFCPPQIDDRRVHSHLLCLVDGHCVCNLPVETESSPPSADAGCARGIGMPLTR